MSFFGFDTNMPPGMQELGGDSLDERLRRMAEADENLEIYDWDDDTGLQGVGGGLAGKLDEGLDAFNDDTFGLAEAEVGRDFDFAGNTAHYLGEPVPTASNASAPSKQAPRATQQQQQQAKRAPASPFSISFDADPLLGPVQANRGQQRSPFYQAPPVHQQQAQQQWARQDPAIAYQGSSQPAAAHAHQQGRQPPQQPPSKFRTVEEIEAEMVAAQQARHSAQASPAPPGVPARTPLTVEEVEAEMMRKAQAARQAQLQQAQQQQQQQQPPQQPSHHPMARQGSRDPGAVQVLAQQAQMLSLGQQQVARDHAQHQAQQAPVQQFPPLQPGGQQAPPQGDNLLAQLLAATPQGQQMQQAGISLHDVQLKQTMEERMRANAAAEEARRRKAAKIHRMAKHNGVMTQGDKDFITRIQVSQLINSNGPNGTHDPYSDDFYFAVIQSMRQGRLAALQQQAGPLGAGPPGPQGPGPQQQQQQPQGRNRNNTADKRMTRRENAMNRMTQQVQRLVDDAKKKPRASNLSLDGALGKIAVRTRSAPRPLLQVDNKRNSVASLDEKEPLSAADLAGSLASALPTRGGAKHGAAMTRKETLAAIEHLYDVVLKLEQARRPLAALVATAQAENEAEQAGHPVSRNARTELEEQEKVYKELVEEVWKGLKVMEPLDASTPHPFISIMSVTKGKKLLPRILRHISYQQTLVLLTLLIATFDTLDVVKDAPILDMNPNDPAFYATSVPRGGMPLNVAVQKKTRKQVENETELFLKTAMPLVMGVIAKSQLRIIAGMLGLLIERNDLIKIAKTKPGLAFITVFISGAQTLIKSAGGPDGKPAPEQSELDQWTGTFNHLVSRLSGHLPSLFPSTRSMPFGPGIYTNPNSASAESILDAEDEPVWHFLAALAVSADMYQQQQLVTEVRDKVLENVMKAKSAAKQVETQGALAESVAKAKIENVNTFLHALGLDASQITVE